jgi:hypothetical protein
VSIRSASLGRHRTDAALPPRPARTRPAAGQPGPVTRPGLRPAAECTFRQVGVATGIALLGSLFAARVPGLGARAPQRPTAALAARSALTAGLNHILLVAAVIALVSGVLSLLPIRSQDFVPATQE